MIKAADSINILPTVASLRAVNPKAIGDALVRPGVLAAVEQAIVAVADLVQHPDASMLYLAAAVERATAGGGTVTDEAIVAELGAITTVARLGMHHAELLMERAVVVPAKRVLAELNGSDA